MRVCIREVSRGEVAHSRVPTFWETPCTTADDMNKSSRASAFSSKIRGWVSPQPGVSDTMNTRELCRDESVQDASLISEHNQSVAEQARQIYAEFLQSEMEASHMNQFVAIEPESRDYFVADSFSQAVANARRSHPDRISFVIRVGHKAALHLGGISN